MQADRIREQASQTIAVNSEPSEDWIATVIRRVLRSSVGIAEPPPTAWIQIRKRIKASDPSSSFQEDNSIP